MSQMVTPETVYPASSPRIRRPEFALVFAVIALMLAAGAALVIWTSANATPATIVAPGSFDHGDVAALRGAELAAFETERWLASPSNVAALRAEELVAHREALWLASSPDVGTPAEQTAVPDRWAQIPI